MAEEIKPLSSSTDQLKIEETILIYDGECKLCNSAVWLLKSNQGQQAMQYLPMQSEAGQMILKEKGISLEEASKELILIDPKISQRGEAAAIQAGLYSSGWLKAMAMVSQLFPRFLRRWVYGLVARWRK